MSWLQAIILGMVQGLTEFLPISSSAHLRIVSELFWGDDAGASFTAVTQIGTELAVLVYFARDIFGLVSTWLRGFGSAAVRRTAEYRLAWYVIIGSIPIGVLGVLFKDEIRGGLRNLWITASMLAGFALVMAAAERFSRQRRSMHQMRLPDGIGMGLAQALALVPGVSRSGGTLSAGLALGLTRPAAARYSFLLAIPAVLAAGIFSIPEIVDPPAGGMTPSVAQTVVATVVAFALGYASIAWLLRYVAHHTVYLFVWYRVVVGLIVMGLLAGGVIPAL